MAKTDDSDKILNEKKTFYENLYSSRNVDTNNSEFDIFFNNSFLTPLNENQ